MPFRWLSSALPEKYHFSHKFAFALHDELVGWLAMMNNPQLRSIDLKLKSDEEASYFRNLDDEQLLEWLVTHGYETQAGDLVFRHLVYALIGDSCHFLYEALRCSEKAKLTVTYSLLRKPLRDNLLYLEYLLGAPDEFLNAFWEGPPKALAFESLRDRGKILSIIRGAIARTVHWQLGHSTPVLTLRTYGAFIASGADRDHYRELVEQDQARRVVQSVVQ